MRPQIVDAVRFIGERGKASERFETAHVEFNPFHGAKTECKSVRAKKDSIS